MTGAIFYSGQYGSTAQYAAWISQATGLPAFDVKNTPDDPSKYSFLVLGSSVIIGRLTIRRWLKRNLAGVKGKPIILFTVSGAPPGKELDAWVTQSLPDSLGLQFEHVGLRGRLDLSQVSWWIRLILRIGALGAKDPEMKDYLLNGFDAMDRSGIEPVSERVRGLLSKY